MFLSERPVELVMMVLQADSQEFTTRLAPMVSRISAEATALSLHCFTDRMTSLESVVQDRWVKEVVDMLVMIDMFQVDCINRGCRTHDKTMDTWLCHHTPQVFCKRGGCGAGGHREVGRGL